MGGRAVAQDVRRPALVQAYRADGKADSTLMPATRLDHVTPARLRHRSLEVDDDGGCLSASPLLHSRRDQRPAVLNDPKVRVQIAAAQRWLETNRNL